MGYVYVIEAVGQKRFKIGKSEVLPRRFNELDTASPSDLRIYGAIKSDNYHAIEDKLHKQFDQYRIIKQNGRAKEWFRVTKKQIERAVFMYGGFCAADGEYAIDAPILEKIIRWLDDHCPRTIEKLCHATLGILMLCYIASKAQPDIIPDMIIEIPAARGFVPKIELVQDYHMGLFEKSIHEIGIYDLGVTTDSIASYWRWMWDKNTIAKIDSLYRDVSWYPEWKTDIAAFSTTDSIKMALESYVSNRIFRGAYWDSSEYTIETIKWFTHDGDTSACPLKGGVEFEIDGKKYGRHNDCLEELNLRKPIAEKANVILKKIRKIYPSMTP